MPLIESWHLSYRFGAAKPDPALFHAALRALGVAAATRRVMVGDSVDKDVRPAVELGMRALWIPHVPADDGAAGAAADEPESAPALPPGALVARDLHEARATLCALLGSRDQIGVDRRP